MKTAASILHRTVASWLRLLLTDIPFRHFSLILNDPDVSGGRLEIDIAFGRPRQLLELTLISTTPEGAAPWCR
jgi:hypothetical protein